MAIITKEMQEVLERFERAVRNKHELAGSGDGIGAREIIKEYQEAKAELTECLSWVP